MFTFIHTSWDGFQKKGLWRDGDGLKLKNLIGCNTLLLEGGSIINGAFERARAVDELSLVVAPTVADNDSKPLFMDADIANFELVKAENENGNLVLNYKRTKC